MRLPCSPPTTMWNFFHSEAINFAYENTISSRFDSGRFGRGAREWLRDPGTCLYSPTTGGRSLLSRPVSSARARAGSSGTAPRHCSRRLSTPAGTSGGRCSATQAGAGLRLDLRLLELEWRGLGLHPRRLGSAPFPRRCLVWRSLGLSRRAARLGARPLALRLQWLE
jgi:hypothetical protein